ncbi:cytochrome c oxidase subunit 4 isoform 1, mitochondrial-like [Actinia tenebrosa]|uniref:Cytochrome c oxidase subunit 4 isoform 1, mitochondrial-like n=1 Tax=Actinia tenebrosa TaxID=6105 RepID=A0A6P8I3G1_ACTTE|nr:cytochrome c oxidase subunit 4 isoform 1, mitochondrial-like [Actinia tenebrosa]
MANFLRLSCRLVGRRIHTSAPRKFDPVPTVRAEIGSDLEALKQKEKGPWSALTKEEKVALYRSQFPKTLAESRYGEPYGKKVIGGVSFLVALSLGLFAFLRTYIGPDPPHTLSDEWVKASQEKMIRQRANPITGISSKQ